MMFLSVSLEEKNIVLMKSSWHICISFIDCILLCPVGAYIISSVTLPHSNAYICDHSELYFEFEDHQ